MNIEINADDFGMNENKTDSILACFADGSVTHASCMVNMPDCERAMELARGNGLIDRIGLHLNVTEGFPLAEAMRRCRTFCDENGLFNKAGYRKTLSRHRLSCGDARCLAEEVKAQIARFRALGGTTHRSDTHHHAHWDWGVARVAVPLLTAAGLDEIRIGVNFGGMQSLPKRLYRGLYNTWLRRNAVGRSDYFCGVAGLIGMSQQQWPDGLLEVMVHPMLKDGKIVDGNVCEMSLVKELINKS